MKQLNNFQNNFRNFQCLLLFFFLLTTISSSIYSQTNPTTRNTNAWGYEKGVGGNGYALDYEFSTTQPYTYLLQKVEVKVIFKCGNDVVLERVVEYYEWFQTGRDGKFNADQHHWRAPRPEAILNVLAANGCRRPVCDPMTASVEQNFELGLADVNLVSPLRPTYVHSNGAKFGYLAGGVDMLILHNCPPGNPPRRIRNPSNEDFTRGNAPPLGGRFGFSFANPGKNLSITHKTTSTFTRGRWMATPGAGQHDLENYDAPRPGSHHGGSGATSGNTGNPGTGGTSPGNSTGGTSPNTGVNSNSTGSGNTNPSNGNPGTTNPTFPGSNSNQSNPSSGNPGTTIQNPTGNTGNNNQQGQQTNNQDQEPQVNPEAKKAIYKIARIANDIRNEKERKNRMLTHLINNKLLEPLHEMAKRNPNMDANQIRNKAIELVAQLIEQYQNHQLIGSYFKKLKARL